MADIDVTFATNAGTAATQIDHAAASTTKAAQAAGINTKATQQESLALKGAAAAAREKALAERQNEIATNKAAAATRQMNARAGRGAGVLGGGRAFGAASSLMGMGASTGALVGATVAFAGVGIAIGLLTEWIGKWLNESKENAKRLDDLGKGLDDAQSRRGSGALGAASEFGGNIRMLTSLGGDKRDLANKYSSKYGFADSSEAVIKATQLFPEKYKEVLQNANDAAQYTGQSLTHMVEIAKGMSNSVFDEFGQGAAAMAGRHLGRTVSPRDFVEGAERNEGSSEVDSLNRLAQIRSVTEHFNIAGMSWGVIEAEKKLTETVTEHIKAAAALTEEYNKQQAAIEASRKFWEGVSRGQQDSAYYGDR